MIGARDASQSWYFQSKRNVTWLVVYLLIVWNNILFRLEFLLNGFSVFVRIQQYYLFSWTSYSWRFTVVQKKKKIQKPYRNQMQILDPFDVAETEKSFLKLFTLVDANGRVVSLTNNNK